MNERIGVYICHCGGNISDVVDVKKVVEAAKKEKGVVVAKDYMFMCSDAGQKMIEEDIKNHNLDGVVVAACSPKLHEVTFRNVVTKAGLNPYVFFHANIREHGSWPHSDDPAEATSKAIRHVKGAIAYIRNAKPLEKIVVSASPSVLIVGGGIAGIRAAIDASRAGMNVYLVEKEPFLGGRTTQLGAVYPYGRSGEEVVKGLVDELRKRDNVVIFTNAEVESINGYVGNFDVSIKVRPRYVREKPKDLRKLIDVCPVEVPDEFNYGLVKRKAIYLPYDGAYPDIPVIDMQACTKCGECAKLCKECIDLEQKEETIRVKVGAIIVATGFAPYEPKDGEFGYLKFRNVLTLPQLVRLLEISRDGKLEFGGKEVKSMAFIYCVGSRQRGGNEYCSRYCCNAAIYTSLTLLDRYREVRLYHLYRDIRTYGKYERYYEEACKKGVVFVKFNEEEPPVVKEGEDSLIVEVKDLLTGGENLEIPVDLVVLVTGMVPRKNDALNSLLKVPFSKDGFYQEVHPKLRPVETALAGIFISGTCQGPKDIKETLFSASASVCKAVCLLIRKRIELEPFVAHVDPDKCDLNMLCMKAVSYTHLTLPTKA